MHGDEEQSGRRKGAPPSSHPAGWRTMQGAPQSSDMSDQREGEYLDDQHEVPGEEGLRGHSPSHPLYGVHPSKRDPNGVPCVDLLTRGRSFSAHVFAA